MSEDNSDDERAWLNRSFKSIDTIDVFSLILLVTGGAVISGFAVVEVAGYNLDSVAHTLGTAIELTWAMILPAVGLTLAVSTNDFNREDYDEMSKGEMVSIGVVVFGLLAVIFAPDIAALVEYNVVSQGVYTALHGAAGLVIASEGGEDSDESDT